MNDSRTEEIADGNASADRELLSPPRVEAPVITSDRKLDDLCRRWLDEPVVGLDTEFVRTRTFYPKLGLVQVAWRDEVALLDAVAIEDWGPFVEVLQAEEVVKVVHSPSEDLEVFHHLAGVFPTPLFDTQIAAILAGFGGPMGYQRLVQDLIGVDLPKGEQRSNWLKRPLSSSQLRYAALDVVYLLDIAERLGRSLVDQERWGWLLEEMQALLAQASARLEPRQQFERLARGSMDDRQLRALHQLNEWRESEARNRDLPRRFVVGDDVLIEAAKRRPTSNKQLHQLSRLGPRERKRYGAAIVDATKGASDLDLDIEIPPRVGRKNSAHKQLVEVVKSVLEERATELQLPADFLLTRKEIDLLVDRYRSGDTWRSTLQGWRREVLEGDLQERLDAAG